MSNYKVELIRTNTFVVDIEAENEGEAKEESLMKFKEAEDQGIDHYLEVNDPETTIGNVYDVTGTDDPFNP